MSGFLTSTVPYRDPDGRRHAVDRGDEDPFLVVDHLSVRFPTHDGLVQAVTDLSYTVQAGRDARHRRRVRLGQERLVDGRARACTTRSQTRLEGSIRVGGTGGHRRRRRRPCASCGATRSR